MILKVIMFFVGIYLISKSITFMIIYLNLLKNGYNFLEYVNFISKRVEILIIFLGIFLVYLSIRKEKR